MLKDLEIGQNLLIIPSLYMVFELIGLVAQKKENLKF